MGNHFFLFSYNKMKSGDPMLISDSRKIKEGDTFIALKMPCHDGHQYIEDAIQKGAKTIICEHGNCSVKTIIVPDTQKYLKEYCYQTYYPQIKDLKLIGITGTSGKTTTCYFLYQFLKQFQKKVAYIGTLGFYIDEKIKDLANTTPTVDEMYALCIEAKKAGCEYVVMEVSSHALAFDRIYQLKFDAVGFTNLSREHMDYHKTMENYVKEKQKLFTYLRNDKIAVINEDDFYASHFIKEENQNIFFGKHGKNAKIIDYKTEIEGSLLTFSYKEKIYDVTLPFFGDYNAYNYLMSLLILDALHFPMGNLIEFTTNLKTPPGRMEAIINQTNLIFIDYAHKPGAVQKVLETVEKQKKNKLYTILGCGGNQEITKRKMMGKIASEHSDFVFFTNDNPRDEDPKKIIEEMLLEVTKQNYKVIYDRKEAIREGISKLNQEDILLILGKGNETYQEIQGKKYPFKDKEVVFEILKERKN